MIGSDLESNSGIENLLFVYFMPNNPGRSGLKACLDSCLLIVVLVSKKARNPVNLILAGEIGSSR